MNIFKLIAECQGKLIIAQLPNSDNMLLTVVNDGCLEQKQISPQWVNQLEEEQQLEFVANLIALNKQAKVRVDREKKENEEE